MYVLICHTKVIPEKVELYEQTFRDLAVIVREQEPGVVFYELLRDHRSPNSYILVEAYLDEATQEAHLNADYYKKARAVIDTCIDGDLDIQVYETIGH